MKFGAVPETWLERLAMVFNLAPRPLVETQVAFTAARAIMAGTSLGIFEALADGPRTAEEVAATCATDPQATRALLTCLVGLDYLVFRGGRYANRRVVRRWILRSSPRSLHDKLVFQATEWRWLGRLEECVATGRPIDFHATMTPDEWGSYQRAMRAVSCTLAGEVARTLPVPPGATTLLDIGGSHGLFSAALCRRHPALRATVLELPSAVPEAAQLAEPEGLGARLRYRAGDALTDDIGQEAYDLVLLSNVAHHFTGAQNRDLSARVARALRPGGLYAIGELERSAVPRTGDAVGATTGLYFALTSRSGSWSLADLQGWQRDAGLRVHRALRYAALPGYVTQLATRS